MQIDSLAHHASMWQRIQPMLDKQRIPQSLLFVGPRLAGILEFSNRLMARLMCENVDNRPCGQCRSCRFIVQGTHPDIHYMRQETPTSPIKIEQVRSLQSDVYQTPQMGSRRFIVIEPADRLNTSAANALLKILEEPPSHTSFILIAEHVSTLPATIMSRCQQYVFAAPLMHQLDYLAIGAGYEEGATRSELFKQREQMVRELCDLLDKKISVCTIAARWSSFALNDVLWFLYLLTADAIRYQLLDGDTPQTHCDQLMHFSSQIPPVNLFKQLDNINALYQRVQQNITLNQTLAVEVLLLGYMT